MPIYEYQCSKCGSVAEVLQLFSDKPLSQCDQCGGNMNKLISQSTFHLKGSGWYVTDYANKKANSPKKDKGDQKKSPKKPAQKEPTPPT